MISRPGARSAAMLATTSQHLDWEVWPHRRRGAGDAGDTQRLPRTRGVAKSNREALANGLVGALWPNGHRSDSGDKSLRRGTTAIYGLTLQTTVWCTERLKRCASSPWCLQDGRRGRRWPELSDWLRNLAKSSAKEQRDALGYKPHCMIASTRMTKASRRSSRNKRWSLGWSQSTARRFGRS
jgi:hypothetical protein